MLSKQRRISRREFPKLAPSRVIRGPLCNLAITNIDKTSRFSISVSKKIHKSAVIRNRIRRWGYRAIQENLQNVNNGALLRFVVYKKPDNYGQMRQEIVYLLEQSGILRK